MTLPLSTVTDNDPQTGDRMGRVLLAARAIAAPTVFTSRGGCTLSSTNTDYTDITGALKLVRKYGSSAQTSLFVIVAMAARQSSLGSNISYAIGTDSADYPITVAQYNTANERMMFAGMVEMTDLESGAYIMRLRAKSSNAASTMTIDSSDAVHMLFWELAQ